MSTRMEHSPSLFLKNDIIFVCVYFGLEAIIVAVFLRRAIDIHQNILGVTP